MESPEFLAFFLHCAEFARQALVSCLVYIYLPNLLVETGTPHIVVSSQINTLYQQVMLFAPVK
jgi:Gpi18-like mannosyltransferase